MSEVPLKLMVAKSKRITIPGMNTVLESGSLWGVGCSTDPRRMLQGWTFYHFILGLRASQDMYRDQERRKRVQGWRSLPHTNTPSLTLLLAFSLSLSHTL